MIVLHTLIQNDGDVKKHAGLYACPIMTAEVGPDGRDGFKCFPASPDTFPSSKTLNKILTRCRTFVSSSKSITFKLFKSKKPVLKFD